MARHDPAAMQLKMQKVGYKAYDVFLSPPKWRLPAEYLRILKQWGWSPWPAYSIWPCLLAGIVLLIVSVSRLWN